MNVLMLNYEYPPLGGGGAAVCRDLSETLAGCGDKVAVVTMAFHGLAEREDCNGVEVHRVSCWRSRKEVCHPWEQLTYCVAACRYISKKMNIRQFDVVHCHFIIPTGLLALWLQKKHGIRYIATAHGSDVLGHNNTRFRYLYRLAKPLWISILKHAAAVTAPTRYLSGRIRESYPAADCFIVPNGIFSDRYRAGSREKIIITVSRLQKSKGIQDLIEACAGIDMGGWKVDILGEGPFRKELEALIRRHGLQDKIFLRGYVGGGEHIRYLSRAGIYFTGSWFEAMPVSVLEAMASSSVIIASDIAPHRQLLPEECIYKSKEDLKAKLQKNMERSRFVNHYDIGEYEWINIVKKYKSIYGRPEVMQDPPAETGPAFRTGGKNG